MNTIADRRKTGDRRCENLPVENDSRSRPDRRLNNIMVDWLPDNIVALHPTVRKAKGLNSYKNK
jgi:hypothetical protein